MTNFQNQQLFVQTNTPKNTNLLNESLHVLFLICKELPNKQIVYLINMTKTGKNLSQFFYYVNMFTSQLNTFTAKGFSEQDLNYSYVTMTFRVTNFSNTEAIKLFFKIKCSKFTVNSNDPLKKRQNIFVF